MIPLGELNVVGVTVNTSSSSSAPLKFLPINWGLLKEGGCRYAWPWSLVGREFVVAQSRCWAVGIDEDNNGFYEGFTASGG